ncbi:MAG TPA: DNA methyltransferase [Candidatus Paceibacterota bacterium]|jgi:DNA modification methylase|nr:DNA methyltransferase [Candidatus Paceibacterota bacterium]
MSKENLLLEYVAIESLKDCEYNPRIWSSEDRKQLKESLNRFGVLDALIVNSTEERMNVVVGGNFRLSMLRELGHTMVPIVRVHLSLEKEKELNIRLNKNQGSFDINLLAAFDESFLADIGFDSEELDNIFPDDDNPTPFSLSDELEKLGIEKVTVQKGDVYDLDGSKLMCGDSTIESDMLTLFGDQKADMCMTDPPYILDYLHGKKRNGKATEGFGLRRDRKYLETDELPDNFTDLWMANVAKIQKPDFSIIVYENPKNLRTIWNVLEKHWKYRNTITWHIPNRVQNFSAKYKLFNKSDIALVGTSGEVALNVEPEEELFQNEYEAALFATSGKPQWESYEKGKKYCPTDFIEHVAADEKSSGQGIIFGTKPLPILIPYIKVLTKRGDIVVEPFGGSGSTLIASNTIGRRCFLMEKVPTYAEVILNRWEKFSGKKRVKIHGAI